MRRRSLLWGAWLLLLLFVITRFTSLESLVNALMHAHGSWLLAALVLHVGYLLAYAELYRVGFRLVGVRSSPREIVPVYLASNVANALAPSGGIAAAALFVDDARMRGQSPARATVGMVVVLLADLLTLLPFLAIGVWFLRGHGDLKVYESAGAAVFAGIAGTLVAALVIAHRWPSFFVGLLEWMRSWANRIGRRFHLKELPAEWPGKTASQFGAASGAILAQPGILLHTLGVGAAMHLLNLLSLALLFLAFGQVVAPGALIAGFAMGIAFYVLSILPQGIAIVEGVMALIFTSLGYPGARIAAIVLAFRGLNYWMPLAVGLPFIRRLAFPKLIRQVEAEQ
jgi:uncharacterized membrane protein YbhN (UPF0104 family)